jgi:hypothetical protein
MASHRDGLHHNTLCFLNCNICDRFLIHRVAQLRRRPGYLPQATTLRLLCSSCTMAWRLIAVQNVLRGHARLLVPGQQQCACMSALDLAAAHMRHSSSAATEEPSSSWMPSWLRNRLPGLSCASAELIHHAGRVAHLPTCGMQALPEATGMQPNLPAWT